MAPAPMTRATGHDASGSGRGSGAITAPVVAASTTAAVGPGVARTAPRGMTGPPPTAPPSTGVGVGDGETVSARGAVGSGRIVTGAVVGDPVTAGVGVGTAG